MQKESNNRKALLCTDLGQPCGVALLQLAFRCPRCGERQRFRSLSSLRPHLEYSHLYRTANNLSPVSRCDVGDVLLNHKKPSEAGCTKNCESSPAKKQGPVDSMGRNEGFKSEATASTGHPQGSTGKEVGPGVAIEKSDAIGAEDCRAGLLVPAKARAERQLVDTLRPADSPIEKRLWKVSTELLKKEAELLDVHTQSRHLALAKQEVLERERALCQQVDTAVMVISSLKEHLRQSEKELEKKEQEVITIHNFLEAAAQQEMCGKVRLRHFIENLLRRIALAEMLLEYYQSGSGQPSCRNHTTIHRYENGYYGTTESWFAGGMGAPVFIPETREFPLQRGQAFSKPTKEHRVPWDSCSHLDKVRNTWSLRRTSEEYDF